VDTDWMSEGNCKDMDPGVFFPSDGVGVRVAQEICATCPVKDPCLHYALVNRVGEGVWGGASERQRKRLRRDRSASATPVRETVREHAGRS
jgi:WhiB family redox-sensing transcriptional regulator